MLIRCLELRRDDKHLLMEIHDDHCDPVAQQELIVVQRYNRTLLSCLKVHEMRVFVNSSRIFTNIICVSSF